MMKSSIVGLVCLCAIVIGSFPNGDAQLIGQLLGINRGYYGQSQQGLQGSVSKADSEAYSRDLKLGNLVGLNGGVVRSQSLTQNEYGATNAAKSTSLSKGVNIGKLGISSTLTGKEAVNNGQVSRGLEQNLNIGKLGIDSSLSRDNLKNGLGVRRSENGGVELGLGLLNVDLSRNKKNPTAGQTGTIAEVDAVGTGANVVSNSNTNSQTTHLGPLTSTGTQSRSNALGSVLRGLTGGRAGGFAYGAPSNAASGLFRQRRAAHGTDFYFPDDSQPGGVFIPQGGRRKQNKRPQNQRHPQGGQQHGQQQFGQPQFGQQQLGQQFRQPQGGRPQNGRPQQPINQVNNNANAQGIANNQNPLSMQQAGANTQSQNVVNEHGQFQGNTGSSIASNLANDGSSGQLSAANTAQQSFQTAQGSGEKNAAQSQSLNFDKGNLQATSSQADTTHTKTADSERVAATSGATANQQNQFGTSANIAQANTENFNEKGVQGTLSNANSQSTFQGANGGLSGANTGSKTENKVGPNGQVSNSASSQASSFSNNGGPASASASSSSGSGPNGGFSNAQGFANAGSNVFAQGGARGGLFGQKAFGAGQAGAFGSKKRRKRTQPYVEPRTFDVISSFFQGLFSDNTSCFQCNIYTPPNQKNCCPPFFPPPPFPRPLPPPQWIPPLPPPAPAVQITSTVFNPWYYPPRPFIPCCPTCAPQIGAFPCGRRGIGQPFPPPYYYG